MLAAGRLEVAGRRRPVGSARREAHAAPVHCDMRGVSEMPVDVNRVLR